MQSRGASDESGSRRCATRGSELRTPPGDSLRHPAKSGLRVLRTGRSSPAAPHPASRRRSCSRLHTEHVHMERTCTARTKCAHRRTRDGGPPPRDVLPGGNDPSWRCFPSPRRSRAWGRGMARPREHPSQATANSQHSCSTGDGLPALCAVFARPRTLQGTAMEHPLPEASRILYV